MLNKMEINKKLLPMKGHFFLFNAGTAPLVPYLSTYARQLGFSSTTVGLIYTVLPVCGLVAKPLFGAIADKFKVQKILFIIFQIVTAVSFFGIYFIPDAGNRVVVDLDCDELDPVIQSYYKDPGVVDIDRVFDIQNTTETTQCNLICDTNSPKLSPMLCDKWNIHQLCNTGLYNYSSAISRSNCDRISSNGDSAVGTASCETYVNNSTSFSMTILVSHSTARVNKASVRFKIRDVILPDASSVAPSCDISVSNQRVLSPTCDIFCSNSKLQELFQRASESNIDNNTQYTTQFWQFFMLMIVSWIGQAVVVSVADAVCFNLLGKTPSRYGRQRLWGSVGWGVFSLLTGVLIDVFSEGAYKDYTVAFILMLVFMSLDVVVSCFIKNESTKMSHNILSDVGSLLTSIPILVFIMWTIGVGFCTGLLWNFLFWHLEDIAGTTTNATDYIKTLQGLVSAIQSFGGEIPFMFLSGSILKRIGHSYMMSLVLLAFGIRFILYSIITNPWWVLPIEMLQGITFGMFYPTMTSYASVVAVPGTETTVQGLTGAVFEGVGVSFGSFLGGRLYETYGGWVTFRWFGYGALIFCGIHFLVQLTFTDGQKPKDKRKSLPKVYDDCSVSAL